MTDLAIVSSKRDAQFAEAVRADLQASGHDVSLTEVLPQEFSGHVVLLWSAALEAAHAIDAQALIGLWSEGRLLLVRRDDTPLPLGLRDLESLQSGKTPADVCALVAEATQDVQVKFFASQSKALYSKPDDRAPAFSRRKSHDFPESAIQKKNSLIPRFVGALIAIAVVGGGAYYYFTADQRARQQEVLRRFEEATKATEELNKAKQAQVEVQKRASEARAAEDAARKSGDTAALKAATEARQKAEAEAAAQNKVVQQREAEVTAKQDAAKKAKVDRERRAEVTEKSAIVAKAEAPKSEAAPSPEAPKAAEAPKAEAVAKAEPAPTAAAPAPAAAPRAMSRSEREAQRDAEAAAKALGSPAEQVAALSPTVTAPSIPAKGGSDAEALYQQALTMEQEGRAADAIRVYRRAARAGHGKAAKRLGDIFDRGVPGVSRDYAESLQWYQTARDLGEAVESAKARGGIAEPRRPEVVAEKSVPAPEPRVPKASGPVSAHVPAPPAAEVREAAKSPAVAPMREAPKAVPAAEPVSPSAAESGWSYGVVALLAILILAFGIVLWRRERRMSPQTPPQPQPSGAAVAQSPGNISTLFVSYSHKDKKRVEPIVSLIEGMGRRVWMDRSDITGQTGWAGQIVRAIRECRAVVLMASPNSYSSDQVVRELYLAMNHKKTIVPIEIEPADLPDELQYILAPFQHHRLSGRETREVLGRALAAV